MNHLMDIQSEQRFLGALLLDNKNLSAVLSQVKLAPSHFGLRAHQVMFESMLSLLEKGEEINMMSVVMRIVECRLDAQCDQGVIADAAATASFSMKTKQAIAHAKIVYQYWQQREFISILTNSAETISQCRGDYQEKKKEVGASLANFLSQLEGDSTETLHYLDVSVKDVARGIIERMGQEDADFPGFKSNLLDLDELITTFRPGQSIIIAGRPSMGKSSLALKFAFEAIKQKKGAVVFFSAEMGYEELITRLIALHGKLDLKSLTDGSILTPEDINTLEETYNYLSSLNVDRRFLIDDAIPNQLAPDKIEATLTQAEIQQGEINCIVFDYLQLIAGGDENNNQNLAVTRWSQFFKTIAKKYDCPVLTLSQLHRGVESRSDKHPMLSDLRDSGSIEQDADIVILLYRQDYYDGSQAQMPDSELEINVAKNRNGQTGRVKVLFRRNTQEFLNLAHNYYSYNYKRS